MYSSSISVKFPGENIHKNLLEARTLHEHYQKIFNSLTPSPGKSSFLFLHNDSTVHIKLSLIPLKYVGKKRFSVKASPHVHQSQEQFVENSFSPIIFQITITSTCSINTKRLTKSIESSIARFMHSTDHPNFNSKEATSTDYWFPTRSAIYTTHKTF